MPAPKLFNVAVPPLALAFAVLALAFAVLALGFAALTTGCSARAPSDSGIEGEVRIGPVSPVETTGTPGSAPYAAELRIRPEAGGRVTRVTSGADGSFRVNLAPGTYTIEPQQGDPLPYAQPVQVTVTEHRFTPVVIMYDSGIR